jgi:hypothetical protein
VVDGLAVTAGAQFVFRGAGPLGEYPVFLASWKSLVLSGLPLDLICFLAGPLGNSWFSPRPRCEDTSSEDVMSSVPTLETDEYVESLLSEALVGSGKQESVSEPTTEADLEQYFSAASFQSAEDLTWSESIEDSFSARLVGFNGVFPSSKEVSENGPLEVSEGNKVDAAGSERMGECICSFDTIAASFSLKGLTAALLLALSLGSWLKSSNESNGSSRI